MPPGLVSAVAPIPSPLPLQRPGPQDGDAVASAAGAIPEGAAAEPELALLAQVAQADAVGPALATLAAATVAQAVPGAGQGGLHGAQAGAGAPATQGGDADALPAAMRLDQRALRQVAWRVPDTERLALGWRTTLLQALDARGNAGARAPASAAFLADAPAAALAASTGAQLAARGAPGAPEALPGWINVYAWGGMRALLGVFALDADEPDPPPRRRRPGVSALRFALEVPGLGRIHACLHACEGGIALDLGAQTTALMQHVRERLPALAAAFGRAGLPLARCRLIDLGGLERQGHVATGVPAVLALSPTLFRAATELWAVLAPPLAA
jgi:hypothetical protein